MNKLEFSDDDIREIDLLAQLCSKNRPERNNWYMSCSTNVKAKLDNKLSKVKSNKRMPKVLKEIIKQTSWKKKILMA